MLLKYRDVMKRLSIGRTTLYELVQAGMLEQKNLPSPPREGRTQGFMKRITSESVERYEAGNAKPVERAAKATKRPSSFRPPEQQVKRFSHFA